MIDFDYYRKINGITEPESFKGNKYEKMKRAFLRKLESDLDGKTIQLIDDTLQKKYKVLIQESSNPLNELKEERKLICTEETPIFQGSLITEVETNKKWLIMSNVDSNGVYKTCKIRECNNILVFYNSFNTLCRIPCILSNKTLYSDGQSQDRFMILSDDKRAVLIPYNEDTKDIYLQERFCFNKGSFFQASQLDDYTFKQYDKNYGVLQLTMIRSEFRVGLDNKEENIASNEIIPIIISFTQSTLNKTINDVFKLEPIVKRGNEIISLTENELQFVVDKTDVLNVDNLGNITVLGVGIANITCLLKDNTTIKAMIEIVCSNVHVDNNKWIIDGLDSIKKNSTVTYTPQKLVNGAIVPTLWDFTIDYKDILPNSLTITTTDTNIKIKNLTNIGKKTITLKAQERGTSNFTELKIISLTDIYGN